MRRIWTEKVRAVLTLAILFIMSSCQFDFQDGRTGPVKVGIYAGGSQTRTEMLPNGLSAAWEAGDELAVWARNSSGSYILAKQIFKTYGIDGTRGFFTAELPSEMPEGTYTYLCCYPAPLSINGTKATFNLPSQQNGKAGGGADIMIADPVEYGPLTPLADPEDHSNMSMRMNRMMHQFRFYLPEGYFDVGEELEEITFTMPQNIAGTVTADFSDPAAPMTLGNGTRTMTLNLSDPIGESASLDDASFACAAVFPYDGVYTGSDYMQLVAYSHSYKATLDPISLSGRTFAAGHSTPVRIVPSSVEKYYRLTMKVGDNHIGEALTNVIVSFNGSPWYSYANADGAYENFIHSVEAYGAEGKEAYDLIVNSILSGVATYTYETEHALVERPLTADMMTYDGNRIVLDLGDVPYLLHEDFTDAKATAHDDDYSPGFNSDMNLGGYLLNGYMPLDGWNAARFSIIEGDCVRINCRFQSGAGVVGRYCGRLDTPALKYLKPGASVAVRVDFDEAIYIPAGFNIDDSAAARGRFHVGYHTGSESSAMNGENGNDLNKMGTMVYTSALTASQSRSDMPTVSVNIPAAGSSTRIIFTVDTNRIAGDGIISGLASNSVYYLYLDNIKVYINQ